MTEDKVKLMREDYPKAFLPWTPQDDEQLSHMAAAGKTLVDMAKALQRQPTAIKRRIDLLGAQMVEPPAATAPVDYLPE